MAKHRTKSRGSSAPAEQMQGDAVAPAPEHAKPIEVVAPEPAAEAPADQASIPVHSSPEGHDAAHTFTPDLELLSQQTEAILISVDRPLPPQRIAEGLGLLPRHEDDAPADTREPSLSGKDVQVALQAVDAAVRHLNEQYATSGRTFRCEKLSAGYRLVTLPAFAPTVADFHKVKAPSKLSRPAIETLAIIAYKQPITRAELEAIRGVSCGEVLKTLIERRLIAIRGRADELGRPMLYGTTRQFLDAFGLASIKDLPAPTEFKM